MLHLNKPIVLNMAQTVLRQNIENIPAIRYRLPDRMTRFRVTIGGGAARQAADLPMPCDMYDC